MLARSLHARISPQKIIAKRTNRIAGQRKTGERRQDDKKTTNEVLGVGHRPISMQKAVMISAEKKN